MAIRTKKRNEINSDNFGNRLWKLMEEEKIDTPGKLADKLIKAGLITPSQSEYLEDEQKDKRRYAIDTTAKKIMRHLKAKDSSKVKGEFILAYSKFFKCSADYLLGTTKIKSPKIEVVAICNKTGLSEGAVNRLIDKKFSEGPVLSEICSILVEGNHYLELSTVWLRLLHVSESCVVSDAKIKMVDKIASKHHSESLSDDEQEPKKTLNLQHRNNCEKFDGAIYRFSQLITKTYEDEIDKKIEAEQWYPRLNNKIEPIVEQIYDSGGIINPLQSVKTIPSLDEDSDDDTFQWNDHPEITGE